MTRFQEGDHVLTLFNQSHLAGPISVADTMTGLGGAIDGTLRQYGAFEESGLVKAPTTLDFKQASTLSCAALTAWNALYGLESKSLKPGDTVLTQGTGGVSVFALQAVSRSPPLNGGIVLRSTSVRQSRRCPCDLHHIFGRKSRGPQEARRRPHHQLQDRSELGRNSPKINSWRPRLRSYPGSRRSDNHGPVAKSH